MAPLPKSGFHNPSIGTFDLEAITKKGYATVEIGTICLMAGKSTFTIFNKAMSTFDPMSLVVHISCYVQFNHKVTLVFILFLEAIRG